MIQITKWVSGESVPGKGNGDCQGPLNVMGIRKAVRRPVRLGRVSKRSSWRSHTSGAERKVKIGHGQVSE